MRVLLALLRRERCSLDRRKDIRLRQTVLGLQQLLRGFNFHEQHLHVLTEECSTLYIEEFEENLRDFVKKLKSTRKIKPPSLREGDREAVVGVPCTEKQSAHCSLPRVRIKSNV